MFNPMTPGKRIAVDAPLQWIKHVYPGGQNPGRSTLAESGDTTKTTYLMTEVFWNFILCELVNSYSHNSFPYRCTQNNIPEHITLQLHHCGNPNPNNIPTTVRTHEHNIPNKVHAHQKCTKDLNAQKCNTKGGGAFIVYTQYTFTTIFTNQFWFELVLTVPMSKSPISTLSPSVDISMTGDGC